MSKKSIGRITKLASALCVGALLIGGCGAGDNGGLGAAGTAGQNGTENGTDASNGAGGAGYLTVQNPGGNTVIFSQASGCYPQDFMLELSTSKEGTIYYTTDGSDPARSSTAVEYTGAIDTAPLDEDELTVSAADPNLFCTSYSKMSGGVSSCYIKAPSADVVDQCVIVRAAVRSAEGSWSETDTMTYFIGSMVDHIPGYVDSAPAVISITMNYEDLFDYETGIYVKGAAFDTNFADYKKNHSNVNAEDCRKITANYSSRGKEWEREAHIDFFEPAGYGTRLVLSEDCGIRIQGNYSRSDLQKSFRLYAREEYGAKKFGYAVFGDAATDENGEVIDKFNSLVLRNGGNCAFLAKYNDTFWQTLVAQDGTIELTTKASRPCVVYLNGEYWGVYVLEEDYSKDYFKDHFGVDKDTVIAYKGDAETYNNGYKLDLGTLPEGAGESYYYADLKSFFVLNDGCFTQEAYDELCSLVDEKSIMDYFAVEVWANNKWDWPGKNWEMWKTTEVDESNPYADGRWRMSLFDIEFGGISGSSDATTNTIAEDNYKPLGLLDKGTNNIPVLCFAYLMDNDEFRAAYIERLLYLSEFAFEKEHALEVLDSFDAMYSPLLDQFFARYPDTGSAKDAIEGGYGSSKCLRDFFEKRADYIPRMIEKTLN